MKRKLNNLNEIIINIYGAFDRFNYGDLLFPLIIKNSLDERIDNIQFEYYGLINSDFTEFGGVKTNAINELFKKKSNAKKEVIIVAGGEIIYSNWFFTLQSLIKNKYIRKANDKLLAIFGKEFIDKVCNLILEKKLVYPFLLDKSKLPGSPCLIYNTVGGSCTSAKLTSLRIKYLKQSSYLSVRDMGTLKNLKNSNDDIIPLLYPDSATLMSKYYPKEVLDKIISNETKEIITSNKQGYICFQISSYWYSKASDIVLNQLTLLSNNTGLPVVLLPIGRAPYHSDQYALKAIKSKASFKAILPSDNSIFDIMALIANSKLFIGTSLHGTITAMSFAIPFVPLTPDIEKVNSYVNTWYKLDFKLPVHFGDIYLTSMKIINMDRKILINCRNKVIKHTEENFDKIATVIEYYKKEDQN